MLTIFRRHQADCPHRSKGRKHRKCACIISVDGTINGAPVRRSLDTRDWQRAQEKIRQWEAQGTTAEPREQITIDAARISYIDDAEARHLQPATLKKYRELLRDLQAFTTAEGLTHLSQIDLAALRRFQTTGLGAPITASKKIERIKAFFRFAQECGWAEVNPAANLKSPKITAPPTMPFEREEMVKILAACENYPDGFGKMGQNNARRLRAFILLLRYSGPRIGDAITLTPDAIKDGKLFLRTAKTGTVVRCPLPPAVLNALDSFQPTAPPLYFWTGRGKLASAVRLWEFFLRKLFAIAGLPTGHAHRFRDTYAVELLLNGVPLERVSALLGHSSIKVTEKHYTPWVRARQEQLEADVVRSWGTDPLLQPAGEQQPSKPN